MTLKLLFHPLSSYCQKVLLALYENGTTFEAELLDLSDQAQRGALFAHWPMGKIPVLLDTSRGKTVVETTIIIEYLEVFYPGKHPLLPTDPSQQMDARFWDRFYDLYISTPMQKIIFDLFRPEGQHDVMGVENAHHALKQAYAVIERHMEDKEWAAGCKFGLADCSAFPALFFAEIVEPFSHTYSNIQAYCQRLEHRRSVQRVIKEMRPYFEKFPLKDKIPSRFVEGLQE